MSAVHAPVLQVQDGFFFEVEGKVTSLPSDLTGYFICVLTC